MSYEETDENGTRWIYSNANNWANEAFNLDETPTRRSPLSNGNPEDLATREENSYMPQGILGEIDGAEIRAGSLRVDQISPLREGAIREAQMVNSIDPYLIRSEEPIIREEWHSIPARPILTRKQIVYTKEEGGNWYFVGLLSGQEYGPYGTEEEAKKHERNINGK
jgi:hypothetical protein